MRKAHEAAAKTDGKQGGISAAAVSKATGKGWQEWFALLDQAGARKLDHRGIVAVLGKKSRISGWWQQMVTVAYEQARGLRDVHQKTGGYAASGSKTVPVAVSSLYAAWSDPKRRASWLGAGESKRLVVRKATPNRSMRITWVDGRTHVSVYFWRKGEAKSQVSLDHEKLADAREAAAKKAYWKEKLSRLQARLEA